MDELFQFLCGHKSGHLIDSCNVAAAGGFFGLRHGLTIQPVPTIPFHVFGSRHRSFARHVFRLPERIRDLSVFREVDEQLAVVVVLPVKHNIIERLVWKNGEPVDLPLVEYKLLCLFMQNPNHLMPREMILDRMWDGNGNFVDDNTLSVYIRRLRNKIEDTPNAPKYLLTERGIGYKWVVE